MICSNIVNKSFFFLFSISVISFFIPVDLIPDCGLGVICRSVLTITDYNDLVTIQRNITDGEPNPGFLLLSSTGVAADKYSGSLGLYGKTSRTWSGAPVWKLNRRDRFLFYNGNNLEYNIHI